MRYTDGYWWSNDGLRLHYRDYAGDTSKPPILCFPGLTRNARDFERLAERLSPEWRVLCIEFRGRGESAYAKDPMTYVPLTYVQDVRALLDDLQLQTFIAFGTSLGGIVSMLLAGVERDRIAGVLLNDIGPEIEASGLERIKGNVGRSLVWPTWVHAARSLHALNAGIYPQYRFEDYVAMAKRLCRLTAQGRIVLDYDTAIAEPFRLPGGEAGIDLWPALDPLNACPVLIVRGELSDILSAKTAKAMVGRLSQATLAIIPDVGHAPTLDEPSAINAIDMFLARVLK